MSGLGLRIGSLFSGIGGLDLGLERAGVGRTVWQCEANPYARKVLAKHWPGVPCFDDVATIDEHVPAIDVICGGFPCQDLSIAGKGKGIHGSRSGLWFQMSRIVRILRPRIVVVENVPAILARGFGSVVGELAASGFDCWWDCIPAASVGAPHRRDRVFVVAHANNRAGSPVRGQRPTVSSKGDSGRNDRGGGAGHAWREKSICSTGIGSSNVAHADRKRLQEPEPQSGQERSGGTGKRTRLARAGWWTVEPNVGRVANGVSKRVDRLKCLGNAVVPQVAEFIGGVVVDIVKGGGIERLQTGSRI